MNTQPAHAADTSCPPAAPNADPIANFPRPICPAYTTKEANAEVLLAEGALQVTWDEKTVSGPGQVCLAWLPSPRITFALRCDGFPISAMGAETVRVRIPDRGVMCEGVLSRVQIRQGGAALEGTLPGPVEVGPGAEFSRVLFHLPNFHPYRGDFVGMDQGACWRGRLALAAGGWALTIDAVEQLRDSQGLLNDVQARAGFGITHVGLLGRADGRPFARAEAVELLEALGVFFSFARGRWTAPLLPIGYDTGGARTWERWQAAEVAPWSAGYSWFPRRPTENLGEGLAGFLSRWRSPDWNDAVRLAIRWYVEGNAEPVSLESSIVLTQAALEALAYAAAQRNLEKWGPGEAAGLPNSPGLPMAKITLRSRPTPSRPGNPARAPRQATAPPPADSGNSSPGQTSRRESRPRCRTSRGCPRGTAPKPLPRYATP